MRRHLVIAAALAALGITPASAAAPVGKTVQASSTVQASGAAGARVLKSAAPVYFHDRLRSNATGIGQFQFVDGSKLALGPNASVVIDKFVYSGGNTIKKLGIQAGKGAFRWISGKSASSAYQIVTPAGTMGIRGTAFDFTVRNGKTYVVLLQGSVSFCGGGSCKTLRRSCDFIVAGGGAVSDPSHLSKQLSSSEARAIFPLLANQGRLTSTFQKPGRSCMTKTVKVQQFERKQALRAVPVSPPTPPTPPAPSPSEKGNKGLGNGGEGDDNPAGGTSETNNPGRSKSAGKGGKKRDG